MSRASGASAVGRQLALIGVLVAVVACGAPTVASGATARASLPSIERQVMCVTCKIPLNVAQSPQADRERAFIQSLIAEGHTEAQIKRALVGQYGQTVLALPSADGFNLAAYLVPVIALLMVLAILALLLPRWRRHARVESPPDSHAPSLSPPDAARLTADMERFD